ncbi:MAG: FecR domain-containing protein [Chthoniobacter sp.]
MFVIRPLSFTRNVAAVALALAAIGTLRAAEPAAITSATVTRVENQVNYGKVIGDKSESRPAVPNDIIKTNNFLMSEVDSRAEMKYDDGTIVRIGQNTIFSFEANTRTLNLKKGTFVFYVPKGKGGGTIKTPSFTAAITGTVGKVSNNIIAVLEGEVTLQPSGRKVPAGFFGRVNADGTIDILPFDVTKAFDGKLMTFNGPLPGLPEAAFGSLLEYFTKLGIQGADDRVNNLPSGVFQFNPVAKPEKQQETKKASPTPVATPRRATPTPLPSQSPCICQ